MAAQRKTKEPSWPIGSLLSQLQPEPGWEIEKAVISTYSADLRVVGAVLLALCGTSTDPELANKVRFAQTLRRLTDRVAFVVQRGRIHRPSSLHAIAGLLDRFVFEADCDEGARQNGRSWHAKFIVMRWRNPETKARSWRLWIGSRNLTRDLSRDVGMALVEGDHALPESSMREMVAATKRLQAWLPHRVKAFTSRDLSELAKTTWQLPTGVSDISFRWIDGTNRFPVYEPSAKRVIAISPFVDKGAITWSQKWAAKGVRPTIVAPLSELAREIPSDSSLLTATELFVQPSCIEEGLSIESQSSAENAKDESEGGDDQELDRSEEASAIHAKIVYVQQRDATELWIGSPNLTRRGWSRNFELAVNLKSRSSRDPWRSELESIVQKSQLYRPAAVPQTVQALDRDEIERVRKWLSAKLAPIQVRENGIVTVRASAAPDLRQLKLVVGSPWSKVHTKPWPDGATVVELGPLDLAECSDLLFFTLSLNAAESSWLMRAPFEPALDQERDRQSLSVYLGPEGLLNLLRAEIDSRAAITGPPWDEPGPPDRSTSNQTLRLGLGPTLEGLLKHYIAAPDQFAALARTVAFFEAEAVKWTPQQQAIEELVQFRELWQQVGLYLSQKGR